MFLSGHTEKIIKSIQDLIFTDILYINEISAPLTFSETYLPWKLQKTSVVILRS